LGAQDRIAEEDLTLDQLFMDANLQKLIGNTDKAIDAFKDILEKYPDNPVASYELSRLYQSEGQFDEALKMAKAAVAGDDSNKWYKILLAEQHSNLGEQSEAVALYEPLINAEPRNEQYYYKQAFFYVKDNDIKSALKVYDQLENKIGITEEIVRRKHALYMGMGDFKKAAKQLIRLSEAFPMNVDYYSQLASFYEQIDDRNAALEIYRKVLELDPDNPKANMAVAGADTGGNDDIAYINSLKIIFEDPSVSIDLKVGKVLPVVQKLLDKPNPQVANSLLELTDILERVHADDAKSFAAAGDILMQINAFDRAIEKYKKAVDIDDTIYAVWEQLLFALESTGAAKDLAKYAENAMDVFPNQAKVSYQAALGYLGLADAEEALYLLEQALLMSGKNQAMQELIISAIGLTYTFDNNPVEAKDAFAKALEINPASGLSNTRYAVYLALNGDASQAEKILNKYNKQGAEQAIFLEAQARQLEQTGDAPKAINLLSTFQATYQRLMPRQIEYLGDLHFKTGQTDQALSLWSQAQNAGIRSAQLKKKIADKKL
jgi:tetratricopeptide (TPR) repeat protein